MRMQTIAAAILALLAAFPAAAADITARYSIGRGAAPAITIRVNDQGDSRIDTDNQMAVLTLDGATYLVMADLGGTYAIRHEDAMVVMAAQLRAMMGEDAPPVTGPDTPLQPQPEPVAHGSETVGGHDGTLWLLSWPLDEPDFENRPMEIVISTDPALAPIGRTMAHMIRLSENSMAQFMGGRGIGEGFEAAIVGLLQRGTALRIGTVFRLDRVETGRVEPSLFVLPATLLTREQFAARRGWASPAGN